MAGQVRRGKVWRCEVWRGLSGLGGARLERLGGAGRGGVGFGMALLGVARQSRYGPFPLGKSRRGTAGMVLRGLVAWV